MRNYIPAIRLFELKALLIALVCHFLFAGLVMIKITPRDNSLQPSLVFLGALLGENDFRNLTSQRNTARTEEATSPVKTKAYPHPLGKLQEVSKPGFTEKKPPHQKAFIKSTFLPPQDIDPSTHTDASAWGINLVIPERTPLKLDEK